MSVFVQKLAAPADAKPLFRDWPETVIWSAAEGVMGDIYADEALTAACARLAPFSSVIWRTTG